MMNIFGEEKKMSRWPFHGTLDGNFSLKNYIKEAAEQADQLEKPVGIEFEKIRSSLKICYVFSLKQHFEENALIVVINF